MSGYGLRHSSRYRAGMHPLTALGVVDDEDEDDDDDGGGGGCLVLSLFGIQTFGKLC